MQASFTKTINKCTSIMRWTTKVIYFDIETAEVISKWTAKENYSIIKTVKNHELNKEAFWGTITITYHCRKNKYKQQQLNF